MNTGRNIVGLFGALGVGAAIIAKDGAFGEMNAAFSEIVHELDLKATNREAFLTALKKLDKELFSSPKIVAVDVDHGSDRRLIIFDFVPSMGQGDFEILIALDYNRKVRPNGSLLKKIFELTDAETRLCLYLSEGLHLDEIAERMDLKVSTVRVYLKSVFEKTGAHRQQDLLSLMWKSNLLLFGQPDTDVDRSQ